MDISCDGFGTRGNYSKTQLGHVCGNDDYCSIAVGRHLTMTLI
jgi:hypothetical protein